MTYTEQLTMMPAAVFSTIAALIFGAACAHYCPNFVALCYIPAMLVGGLSIPLAAYVDFLHS